MTNKQPKQERPPTGRPATLTGGRRVNVYLDDETIAAATRIGSGNLSEGVRAAVRATLA